jgi:RNA polymerase sigma-70 factor (ECF subfamily)
LAEKELKILEGCRRGDSKAQAQLYHTFKATLFAVCRRYAANEQEAEDWLQDGFIRIYQDLYQYKPTGSLKAWMRKVTVNVCLKHIRRQKKLFPTVDLDEIAEKIEMPKTPEEDPQQALVPILQQLPEGYRAVINLYVIEEYSHKEIGEHLGISESSSRSQLTRAKNFMRKLIEKKRSANLAVSD